MPAAVAATRLRERLAILAMAALALLALAGCNRISVPEGWSGGAIDNGTLYMGTSEGEVRAIDVEDGSTRWRFALHGEERYRAVYGTPVLDGDTLYVGGYDSVLYAIALDGRDKWVEPLGDAIVGGPAVADGLVVVGTSDGSLYALDAEDGSQRWSFPTGDKVWSTPALSDGVAYVGSLDHSVYAVALHDGSQQWRFGTGGAVAASPVVHGGRVYVGAFDGAFYALNARTGLEEWRFEGASNWYWARPLVHGDMIMAPSLDGTLYALNADTGNLLWTVETEGPIVGSPAVVADSMIALASTDGRVRLIGMGGSVLDVCNVNEEIRTPLVSEGDFVYFGARDHSIRALRVKPNGNPDEEWVHFTNEESPTQRGQAAAC